jgi:hypothetical protein
MRVKTAMLREPGLPAWCARSKLLEISLRQGKDSVR